MSHKLTVTIDGKDDRVLPDSVGSVLRAVFRLVQVIDERSWQVGTRRIDWRVSEAKLVNPFTLTATGDDRFPDYRASAVAIDFVEQLEEIERGIMPRWFSPDELKIAKVLAVEAKRARRITITGENTSRTESFTVSNKFSAQISRLLKQPPVITTEYGSLDGTLIQLVNDPLKTDGRAKLRERNSENEVLCQSDPETAAKLAHHLDRETRVILYGTITFENGVPKRIHVEDHTTVPADSSLPTLEDLHALQLRPPNGMSAEEYLDDLRGDE
jgi:hypothetical protein